MSAKKDKSDKADAASSNGNPSASQEKPECFVIMPISDPDGYEPGHFGRVFDDLFTPACDRAGYRAMRADQVRQTNLIHLDVLQKIIESPMALCDLSNRNPNVMFELGLRQAFDKPVVLVQEYGTPPIFDITPLRYTEYHREMLYRQVIEDQEKISTAVLATKEAINNSKSVNSIIKLLSLTNAASLTTISEGEKESALFQIIMAELGNLRAEISHTRSYREERTGVRMGGNAPALSRRRIGPEINYIRAEIHELRVALMSLEGNQRPPARAHETIIATRDRLSRLTDYILENDFEDKKLMDTLIKLEKELSEIDSLWQDKGKQWLRHSE